MLLGMRRDGKGELTNEDFQGTFCIMFVKNSVGV